MSKHARGLRALALAGLVVGALLTGCTSSSSSTPGTMMGAAVASGTQGSMMGGPAGQRVPGADGKVSESGSLGEISASCAGGSGEDIDSAAVDRVLITEIDTNKPLHDTVDIALYDSFARCFLRSSLTRP